MKEVIRGILKNNELRSTHSRSEILGLFLDSKYALSNAEIEKEIAEEHDRVTVYRTLRTFLDKGIIHKVLDDSGTPRYALCNDECQNEEHNHEHIHFKCIECGLTTCLEEIKIPSISLPSGYKANEVNILMQGTCKDCQKK
ncbi:transcriptional repressor [marine bacterium AO1-C]|nr:transcriptional repressor [marine bacterium AO1-C]